MKEAVSPRVESLRRVLGRWSLSDVASIERESGGATNWVYRVEASSGSLFLRVYRKAGQAVVVREHELIRLVLGRGVPAVAPLPVSSGETVTDVEGYPCALFKCAEGRQIESQLFSTKLAEAAGLALAELHYATQALPDVGYVRWSLRWDGASWVERLDRVERAILSGETRDETDDWALERVRQQRLWLEDPACQHAHVPVFPSQVTHGDYQHTNIFFNDEQVSAVIDWEQAAMMPRAYEVVRAAAFMFRLEPSQTRAFVDAYVAAAGMSRPELLDGAQAWACFSDHHVWPVEEAYLHGNLSARQYIPHERFRPFLSAWSKIAG